MVPTFNLNPSHFSHHIKQQSVSGPLGLYLHVPFCLARCHFCAFYLQIHRKETVQRYLAALEREIDLYAGCLQLETTLISTIYFGGGTPTTLDSEQLCRMFSLIQSLFHLVPQAEVSVEAHPTSVTRASLCQLADAGFNRISFGVQSMHDSELARLGGPSHTTQVDVAIRHARDAGFSNINMDLMYGLPGQTWETWSSTLDDVIALAPQHISCYALTVEEGTRFSIDQRRGDVEEIDGDLQNSMENQARAYLTAAGYQQYELSNFSRPGFACRHNVQYWQGGACLGLGPSAQSFVGLTRFGSVADLHHYCEELEGGSLPIRDYEPLDREQALRESIIFGLRMIEGVPLDLVEKVHDRPDWQITLPSLTEEGFLERTPERLRLTALGRRFADSVATALW